MSSLKLLVILVGVINSVWAQKSEVAKPSVPSTVMNDRNIEQCSTISSSRWWRHLNHGDRCKINDDIVLERVHVQKPPIGNIRGWRIDSEKLGKEYKDLVLVEMERSHAGRTRAFIQGHCKKIPGAIPSFEQLKTLAKAGALVTLEKSIYVQSATAGKPNILNIFSSDTDKEGHIRILNLGSLDDETKTIESGRSDKDNKNVDSSFCVTTMKDLAR